MEKLIFEEGYKEYEINGDPNRVFRFNPTDFDIVKRIKACDSKIRELQEKFKERKDESIIEESKQDIKKMVDEIFYEGAYDVVFADVHPLTIVKKDKIVLTNFFEAIVKECEKEIGKTQEKQERRKEEYRENVRAITSKRNNQ